jgi:dTDP-4-amino-4,6-dideoxygalactose transaminase
MAEQLAIQGGTPVRTKPFPSWPVYGAAEEEAVRRVLHSGQWGCLGGEEVREFETEFARYQGAAHGIATTNGTAALRVALLAAGIQAGEEVIVPAYTFVATVTAILEVNAVPVFADIDPDTYVLDPARAEAAITPRTRILMPVHFAGQPAHLDAFTELARRHHLTLIEDAAQAHGARYGERGVGSVGDLACFSFQASKNLNAGEGGILLTNGDEYAARARSIYNCGRLPGRGGVLENMGSNQRMTEWQGAILRAQMTRLDEQTDRRDANGRYLNARLAEIPGIRPLSRGAVPVRHAYHLYICRYDAEAFDGLPRERFMEALRAEGIPAYGGYSVPLYEQPFLANKRFGPYAASIAGYDADIAANAARCPVSERACKREAWWLQQTVLLGDRADMDNIVRAVAKVYECRKDLLA